MSSEYYVYGLFEPLDNKMDNCFYIRKGSGFRLKTHFYSSRLNEESGNLHKKRKIKKLIRNNKEPYSRKIVNNLSSCEALEIEKHLIQEIGLDNLTNLCEGGFDGGSLKGEDHPFYGGMPDDIAQKISRNTTGYKMKENHNKNMKEALRGRELSEDHKNNISKAHTGKNITRGIKYQNH